METFAPARELIENPGFEEARQRAVPKLQQADIDRPIAGLISGFAILPHCFTLQCCHGHFVCGSDDEPENNNPIPQGYAGEVRYRIAYVALCIEFSERGRTFRDALSSLVGIDPDYVQFGSPGWFWDQWVNSYALQVEPYAQRCSDEARLDAEEGRHVERIRDQFFAQLQALVVAEARVVGAP
jgi:hypothetical protein